MNRPQQARHPGPTTRFGPFEKDDTAQSLSRRFEQQVGLHGARLALKTKNETCTYDRLNRAANRLARALLRFKNRSQSATALLFTQGLALITAVLAVLKTGRPYVQIDSSIPIERAARQLEDSQANLLVTDSEHLALARALARDKIAVINVDERDDGLADGNLEISVSPERIAYIHYTSGSTGEPKGVVSSHASELNSIRLKTNALHISPDDRISLLRSHNVGATSDALLGLLNGAALFPRDLQKSGLADLIEWLVAEEITVFTCVASVFRHALKATRPAQRLSQVRLVHVGGETVYKSDVELFKKYFPDSCLLVNRLGISETKTACYFFVDQKTKIDGPIVPVGYPLDGYEILILDKHGKCVGADRSGEIAVKSPYLARGYWRRPALTKERFLGGHGACESRVYLSGDLGYLRPDGCLVHLGRKDFQTKIRGHRVEIAEVESALFDIAAIEQGVVVAQRDGNGEPRLVAYLVTRDGQPMAVGRLRAALQKRLPVYMLPSAFVFMPGLPLTASGKIDRRALPLPRRDRAGLENPFVAPRSEVEKALAQLWREVLGVEEVGVEDNFAELGGDSLVATQIAARLNRLFSPAQPVKTLFETPTVASLAQFIALQEKSPGKAERVATAMLKRANRSS